MPVALAFLFVLTLGAGQGRGQARRSKPLAKPSLTDLRNRLVDEDIAGAGIKNRRVIQAMRDTPRHEFMPLNQRNLAYYDMALPIGEGQTISPPFVVAYMTQSLDPQPEDTVLEIGTGSGYQAAVLSKLVKEVYSIEIVEKLGQTAAKTLQRLRYTNVHTKVGDGYQGWPEHAPFDKIIVTCSPEEVPPKLVQQLKEGGRIVIPVGQRYQQTLYLLTKVKGKMESKTLLPTLFVPMTGAAEDRRKVLPDPTNPQIVNGDFEEVVGEPSMPAGWHYLRQVEVAVAEGAPSGKNHLRLQNDTPGRPAQALQAFPVDGRSVAQLDLSAKINAKSLRAGQLPQQLPVIAIVFYDENRKVLGEKVLGPWRGTFDWRTEKKRLDVPKVAREAILRIDLFGATGELGVDDLQMKAVKR